MKLSRVWLVFRDQYGTYEGLKGLLQDICQRQLRFDMSGPQRIAAIVDLTDREVIGNSELNIVTCYPVQ